MEGSWPGEGRKKRMVRMTCGTHMGLIIFKLNFSVTDMWAHNFYYFPNQIST